MLKKFIFLCSILLCFFAAQSQNCDTISSFPYSEDFSNFSTNCWSYTATTQPYAMVNNSPVNGNMAMMFMCASGNYNMAIMPIIDTNIDLHSIQITFSMFSFSSSYLIELGVISDPTDITTYQMVGSYTMNMQGAPAYIVNEVNFSNITGNPHYIAFRYAPTLPNSSNIWIDNITLSQVSACAPPTNLVISNISGSSALLSWTASPTAASYGIEVVDNQGNSVISTYTDNTTYPISGLSEQTEYFVNVYPICMEGTGDTISHSLVTQCNQIHQTVFVGENPTNMSYGGNVPFCIFSPTSYTQEKFSQSEIGPAQDIRVIELNYFHNSAVHVDNLKIFMGHSADSVFSCSDCWVPQDSLIKVYDGPVDFDNSNNSNWFAIMLDTTFSYNGIDNLVIAFFDTISDYPIAYPRIYTHPTDSFQSLSKVFAYTGPSIDLNNPGPSELVSCRGNIKFVQSCYSEGCVAPNLMITQVEDFSADMIIAGNTGDSFEIQYKAATDTAWNIDVLITEEYEFANLNSNTVYNVRVRTLCANGEVSDWAVRTFRTTCGVITELPWSEDFSYYAEDHQNIIPSCWTVKSNYAGFPTLDTTLYATEPASLHVKSNPFSYNVIALPELDNTLSMSELMLSVSVYAEHVGDAIEIGFMTDPQIDSTYTAYTTITPTQLYEWQSFDIQLNEYEGTAAYLVFKSDTRTDSTENEILIDNILLMNIPACPRPTAVRISEIGQNSVEISWNGNSEAVDFMVGVFPAGTEPVITEFEYTVGDSVFTPSIILTPNTAYDVYVSSICISEISPYTEKITFRTLCESINFTGSYTENFDNNGNGFYAFPQCWTRLSNNPAKFPYLSNYYTFQSSTGALYLSGSSFNDTMMVVSPDFDSISIPLQVTFQLRGNATYLPVQVGLITDPNDMSTFIPVATVHSTLYNTWEEQEVVFAQHIGQVTYIAIRTSGDNAFYIDNFEVSEASLCFSPEGLSVANITTNSAELNWNEMGTAQTWMLEYGESGFADGAGTIVTTTTKPHIINGLQPATAYEFRVMALCSSADSSDWSDRLPFNTDILIVPDTCDAPINLGISEVSFSTATLSWTPQNDESEWQVSIKKHTESNFINYVSDVPHYTFQNLDDSCLYDAQVIAICNDTLFSDVAEFSFTTLANGIYENSINQSVIIYPIPTENSIEVVIDKNLFNATQIALYNNFGQIIMIEHINDSKTTLDLSDLSAGFYFIKISDDKNVVTKKIIKK